MVPFVLLVLWSWLGGSAVAVGEDLDFFEGDEAFLDGFVEVGEEGGDKNLQKSPNSPEGSSGESH